MNRHHDGFPRGKLRRDGLSGISHINCELQRLLDIVYEMKRKEETEKRRCCWRGEGTVSGSRFPPAVAWHDKTLAGTNHRHCSDASLMSIVDIVDFDVHEA